jgi:hypothetical protein
MKYVRTLVLPYTGKSDGYRDLRHVEAQLPKRRFARVSINGIHRNTRSQTESYRWGNPGWSFGLDRCYVNWTHFRRHCWHLSLTVGKLGITLSYGRKIV